MAIRKEDLRLDKLATHVVDWHNRHPLVRRVSGLRVHSTGYVAVPFLAPPGTVLAAEPDDLDAAMAALTPGGSLRERAQARSASGEYITDRTQPVSSAPAGPPVTAADAAFDDDFFPPYKAAVLADWVAQHGTARPRIPRGTSVRHIPPREGVDVARVHWRWVLTAQVDVGRARTRVLVGAGSPPPVLGQRLWSPQRMAGVALMVAAVIGAVAGLTVGGTSPKGTPRASALAAPQAAPPASPASVVPAPAAPAASVVMLSPLPAVAPAASAAPPATAASAVTMPPDAQPTLGKVDLPSIGPVADERRRAAQQARAEAASANAAQNRALATGPAFAVWTRVLRTRSESDQLATAMRELLIGPQHPKLRVEVLPVGSDWRVVSWPYLDRNAADKARELLVQRGMRVETVEF